VNGVFGDVAARRGWRVEELRNSQSPGCRCHVRRDELRDLGVAGENTSKASRTDHQAGPFFGKGGKSSGRADLNGTQWVWTSRTITRATRGNGFLGDQRKIPVHPGASASRSAVLVFVLGMNRLVKSSDDEGV